MPSDRISVVAQYWEFGAWGDFGIWGRFEGTTRLVSLGRRLPLIANVWFWPGRRAARIEVGPIIIDAYAYVERSPQLLEPPFPQFLALPNLLWSKLVLNEDNHNSGETVCLLAVLYFI
jgi:hypothetical protein